MAVFYVDESGIDDSGRNGSVGQEWASLYYACTRVTTIGDTIHINAGTYNEGTNYCSLAVGVNLEGDGDTSHIIFSNVNSWYAAIHLQSSTPGTNGNQSISYLKLDGNNLTDNFGIFVYQRSNVEIHHCTLLNFNYYGIRVGGAKIGSGTPSMEPVGYWTIGTPPTIYETGNSIHDCTITNCHGSRTDGGSGNIQFDCQEGLRIYNCTITQTGRSDGHNGDCISFWGSHNKDIKIYNCEFFKPLIQTTYEWNIHIEGGTTYGGIEIYNNIFHNGSAGVNVASFGNYKGDYDYAWDIHHNQFLQDYPVASGDISYDPYALIAESYVEYVHFHHNYIKYFPWGISYSSNHIGINNCNIYSNIFDSCGYTNSTWSFVMAIWATGSSSIGETGIDVIVEDINIYNNTVVRSLSQGAIILANGDGTYSNGITRNINIKNNIFTINVVDYGYGWAYIVNVTARMTDIYVYNNNIYGNNNSNGLSYYSTSVIPTNYDEQNTNNSDPVFVSGSDYHLQSISPAIGAGINVDLDTDYDNVSWNTFPSIGAYEYVNILYIDPSGNDTTGDGSLSTPWKTLYKASTEATWGDTIHVNPGTYTENTTCILSLGVSIVGEGDESIITTTNSTGSWMLLYLVSTNEGTKGNHVFKDLKFDGNDETGCYCFYIRRRGNIEIDNCTFIDWERSAFNYGNFTSYGIEPTTYATGISIHDSYFYNSSGLSTPGDGWTSQGTISFGGTEGMLIYNNDIILPELDHTRGLPIKCVSVGWNKGLKIYDNNILKYCNQTPPSGHPDLPFALELWDTRGGCEIYNNTILGDVDLVRTSKGDYEFGAKVHHNIMGPETNDVTNPYPGVSLEHFQHDVYIYQNHFRNMTSSISSSSGGGGFPGGDGAVDDYNCVYENVYVYNNLMTNIGAKWVSAEFDASTNIITSTERHRLGTARNRIRLSGDLPAELNTTTLYYVVNPTEYTFQVSLTNGGAAIDFSSNASAYFSHNVYNRACGFGTTTYNCSFQGGTNTVYDSDLFRIKENTAMYLGGTLPAELNSSTLYYAQNVTSTTFQLATSRDGAIIDFTGDSDGTYTPIVIVSGFYFYNNVIEGMLGGLTQSAFFFMLVGMAENVHIKNNIITNMTYTPVWGRTSYCTFDRLEITNNIVYNCGNGNEVVYDYGFDGILTNYVYDPFIEQDPLFISTSNTEPDYHVNEASPAIGAGTYVGLVYDYDGTVWNNPPSIGAYEYGSMVGVRSKVLNYSTIPLEISCLITTWTNFGFATFTNVGRIVTAAINNNLTSAHARSNYIAVTPGDYVKLTFDVVINSGDDPLIQVAFFESLGSQYNIYTLANGVNTIEFRVPDGCTTIRLTLYNVINSTTNASVNFSLAPYCFED